MVSQVDDSGEGPGAETGPYPVVLFLLRFLHDLLYCLLFRHRLLHSGFLLCRQDVSPPVGLRLVGFKAEEVFRVTLVMEVRLGLHEHIRGAHRDDH